MRTAEIYCLQGGTTFSLSDGLTISKAGIGIDASQNEAAAEVHARFILEDGEWAVEDSGSPAGIFVGENKVPHGKALKLTNNTFITCGKQEYVFIEKQEASDSNRKSISIADLLPGPLTEDSVPGEENKSEQEVKNAPVTKPDIPRAKEQKPDSGTKTGKEQIVNKAGSGKKSSKKTLVVLAAIAAAVILMVSAFAWCRHWNTKGAEFVQNNDLDAAYNAYRYDFLLGGKKEANRIQKAKTLFSEEDYQGAADIYAQYGTAGEAQWKACMAGLGKKAYDEGRYADALQYYTDAKEQGKTGRKESLAGLGKKAYDEGRYADALQYYTDAEELGENGRIESLKALGEEAFSKGKFMEAADYFSEAGAFDRRSDAYYEQALAYIKDKKPEKAINCLESYISNEERAKEQVGVAQMMIAQNLLDKGEYEQAIQKAQNIVNRKLVDVDAFVSNAYHKYGASLIKSNKWQQAVNAYGNCKNDPVAEGNIAIIQKITAGDIPGACDAIKKHTEKKTTDISSTTWQDALKAESRKIFSGSFVNQKLAERYIAQAFKNAIDFSKQEAALKTLVPSGEYIGKFVGNTSALFTIESLNALYKGTYGSIGTKPNKKILIIIQRTSYDPKEASFAISWDLMGCLPFERLPASLEEVQYIVLIKYDYTVTGKYTKSTIAAKEKGVVEIYQLPKKNRTYSSKTVTAEDAPYFFSYRGEPPKIKSGGAPDMSGELFKAIKKLL